MQDGGLAHPGDELVGHARHGGDDDGDLVAGVHLALHVTRDVADALDVGDGGAAELHHNHSHTRFPPCGFASIALELAFKGVRHAAGDAAGHRRKRPGASRNPVYGAFS